MDPTGSGPGPVLPRPALSGGPSPVHGLRIRTAPTTPLVADDGATGSGARSAAPTLPIRAGPVRSTTTPRPEVARSAVRPGRSRTFPIAPAGPRTPMSEPPWRPLPVPLPVAPADLERPGTPLDGGTTLLVAGLVPLLLLLLTSASHRSFPPDKRRPPLVPSFIERPG